MTETRQLHIWRNENETREEYLTRVAEDVNYYADRIIDLDTSNVHNGHVIIEIRIIAE